jgi:hypothetical protein
MKTRLFFILIITLIFTACGSIDIIDKENNTEVNQGLNNDDIKDRIEDLKTGNNSIIKNNVPSEWEEHLFPENEIIEVTTSIYLMKTGNT